MFNDQTVKETYTTTIYELLWQPILSIYYSIYYFQPILSIYYSLYSRSKNKCNENNKKTWSSFNCLRTIGKTIKKQETYKNPLWLFNDQTVKETYTATIYYGKLYFQFTIVFIFMYVHIANHVYLIMYTHKYIWLATWIYMNIKTMNIYE